MGLCGNTPRTWLDRMTFSWDRVMGHFERDRNVALRPLRPGDPDGRTNVSPLNAYVELKFRPGKYYISEIPPDGPDADVTIQGELSWSNGAWQLYYTFDPGYMRDALRNSGRSLSGWEATRMLKRHLDERDYGMLMELFEWYTDGGDYPVIEFSNFRKPWGRLDRPLIIWEIRNGY